MGALNLARVKRILKPLLAFFPAFAAGVLFCVCFAWALGVSPVELLATIGEGAWGGREEALTTLSKVTPLLLTGLAVSLAFNVGLLNIGCEGQLTLGALSAAAFAAWAEGWPGFLVVPTAVFIALLVGGLWALPAVWLRQRRGVHEVVTTLLLNYVAIYLADYLARGPLSDGTAMGRTPEIADSAVWAFWWDAGTVGLTAAPLLALLLSLMAQVWLTGTVWGFEATAAGSNPVAARNVGIEVASWQRRLFLLSGALAGLAGALEVLAVHHRFYAAFSPGYGFDGITIAFLVHACPGWLWLSSLVLASLRATDKWLQLALGISPNAVFVIEAVLLLTVACQAGLARGWSNWRRALTSIFGRHGDEFHHEGHEEHEE